MTGGRPDSGGAGRSVSRMDPAATDYVGTVSAGFQGLAANATKIARLPLITQPLQGGIANR